MKYVDITNQEIVEGFKKSCPLFVGEEIEELHKRIIRMKLSVDYQGDILAQNEDGDRYWITTEPTVTRWNKSGKYEIRMKYNVHKESKYNDKIYEFVK